MNIYEIDWRISSIRRIAVALSQGIDLVIRELELSEESDDPDSPPFDPLDAAEHIENLLGIAFVTAQTYITGTVSDIPKLTHSSSTPTKRQLLQVFSDVLPGCNITKMELCDAIANYWKHHEEGDGWSSTPMNKRTLDILNAMGIGEFENFPCQKVADILWPGGWRNLERLLELVSEWRQRVIECYKLKRRA
jgi:hypothetical protein